MLACVRACMALGKPSASIGRNRVNRPTNRGRKIGKHRFQRGNDRLQLLPRADLRSPQARQYRAGGRKRLCAIQIADLSDQSGYPGAIFLQPLGSPGRGL